MNTVGIVDIETSGFLKQGGKIVEIGIVELNISTGERKVLFDSVVREPGFTEMHTKHPMGWIFQNSNLTYEEVAAAPLLDDVKPQIQDVFDSFFTGITAFNKAFDFGFLRSRGFRIAELPCIMHTATPVLNLPSNGHYKGPKYPNVEEAYHFLTGKRNFVESHRAADDAMHEAEIAFELYKKGFFRF
ncbi:MAG: 3'-5' exonuclease [Salinivirgaceae bacterium]|jgi:DNA polymerase-3 subunit epsilon